MKEQYCCVCSRKIEAGNEYFFTFRERRFSLCNNCSIMVGAATRINANDKLRGRTYLKGKLDEGKVSSDALVMVKYLAAEKVTDEEYREFDRAVLHGTGNKDQSETQSVKQTEQTDSTEVVSPSPIVETERRQVSSFGPMIAGVLLLIAAVILYFESVNNEYGVANIQATVFAAAGFVAAIVCFSSALLIRAINSKK